MTTRDDLFNGGIHIGDRRPDAEHASAQPERRPDVDHAKPNDPQLELVSIPPGVSVASVAPDLVAPQNPAAPPAEMQNPAAGDRTQQDPAAVDRGRWEFAPQVRDAIAHKTLPEPAPAAAGGQPGERANPTPEPAPVPGYVYREPEPIADAALTSPEMIAALQAIRDGAPGIVAVTYLDGDRWNHVVCTQDFNHGITGVALEEWKRQLARQAAAGGGMMR